MWGGEICYVWLVFWWMNIYLRPSLWTHCSSKHATKWSSNSDRLHDTKHARYLNTISTSLTIATRRSKRDVQFFVAKYQKSGELFSRSFWTIGLAESVRRTWYQTSALDASCLKDLLKTWLVVFWVFNFEKALAARRSQIPTLTATILYQKWNSGGLSKYV